ncbi:unnamed protein product, partial [Ectocarpus fasciculatus]
MMPTRRKRTAASPTPGTLLHPLLPPQSPPLSLPPPLPQPPSMPPWMTHPPATAAAAALPPTTKPRPPPLRSRHRESTLGWAEWAAPSKKQRDLPPRTRSAEGTMHHPLRRNHAAAAVVTPPVLHYHLLLVAPPVPPLSRPGEHRRVTLPSEGRGRMKTTGATPKERGKARA